LVATAILGIAITVILQLFSANLRAISASDDYVSALTKAGIKMRAILNEDTLFEKEFSEITYDGYRMDVSITEVLRERTEFLPIQLFEITLTIHWQKDWGDKSTTLRTMKAVKKEI
jgi:hypothetical protein